MKFIKVHYFSSNQETYISVNSINEITRINAGKDGIDTSYTNIYTNNDCLKISETPEYIFGMIE